MALLQQSGCRQVKEKQTTVPTTAPTKPPITSKPTGARAEQPVTNAPVLVLEL